MLREVCRNWIVKIAFKSAKPILTFAWTNAQTEKKIKNIVLSFIKLMKVSNNKFSYISTFHIQTPTCYDFILSIDIKEKTTCTWK